jgi:magnesium transporter
MITILYAQEDNVTHSQDAAVLSTLLPDTQRVFWLDLEAPTASEFDLLRDVFHFHPLAIEDAMRPHQRPKLDEYDGYCFLVADEVSLDTGALRSPETEEDAVQTRQLSMFLGANYLVTIHIQPVEAVRSFRERCDHRHTILERDPGFLLYSLLDVLVDRYFPLLETLDGLMDDLEDRIVDRPEPDTLQTIFAIKRNLTRLRRHAAPLREVLQTLTTRNIPGIQESALPYLRDVADHLFRIYETLDSYRDLMSNMLDAYLSQVSNEMNRIMQKLTAVATVFLPLTFITGVFGMNFAVQPWLHTNFWFWMVFMAALGIGTYAWFHRRKIV